MCFVAFIHLRCIPLKEDGEGQAKGVGDGAVGVGDLDTLRTDVGPGD